MIEISKTTAKLKCSSHQQSLLNISMFPQKLLDYGHWKEKLNILQHQKDIIDTNCYPNPLLFQIENELSMEESPLLNNPVIYNIKSITSFPSIQNIPLSKILGPELILKEKVLSPFWDSYSKDLSKKLLLPIGTDLQELDLTSLNSFVNNSTQNLQFCQIKKIQTQMMNSQKTLCQLSPILPQNTTDFVNIKYTRKIRFYPNQKQIEYFKKCFGVSRYFYNKTIDYFKENGHKSFITYRSNVMKSNKDYSEEEKWITEIPYDTRQLMIKSAHSMIKSNFELKKKGIIKHFNLKYKSRKNPKQIFFVDHRAVKNLNLFPDTLKNNSKLIVRGKYKKYYNYIFEHDCIIQKNNYQYFLLVPKEKDISYQKANKDIVSLDPGIRSFQTFYTPDGYVGDLGTKDLKDKLKKLTKKLDLKNSLYSKTKNKKKKLQVKKKCSKLRTKIKNIVSNFHWKMTNFLCKNFNIILLPKFETKKLMKTLDNYNNRMLSLLSHYSFRQKLEYQSLKYQRDYRLVKEDYTSLTCGCCGNLNYNLGKGKVFHCNKCNITMDRDHNAARNVLIKNYRV
jgi:putative transposase